MVCEESWRFTRADALKGYDFPVTYLVAFELYACSDSWQRGRGNKDLVLWHIS